MTNPGGCSDKFAEEQQLCRDPPQNARSDGEKEDASGSSSNAPREGNEIRGNKGNGGSSSANILPPHPNIAIETAAAESGNDGCGGEKEDAGGSSSTEGIEIGGKEGNGRIARSSSANILPPHPNIAIDAAAAKSGNDGGRKKSGGDDTGTTWRKPRKKSIFRLEKPSPCFCCGKQYDSWKALFAHMKKHRREREWRGCFPPPEFNPPEKRKVGGGGSGSGVSTFLQLAEGVMARMLGGVRGVGDSSVGVVDIDLNVAVEEPIRASSPPPVRTGGVRFDLNMPAPECDEDDADA